MANLILTLGIGEPGRKFLEISLPLMKNYARRIGAECQVIDEAAVADPLMLNFEKFQIRHFFKRYRRILYLDADVIIMPGAANIFKKIPAKNFAAWDESSMVCQEPLIQAIQHELEIVPGWDRKFYNAGIFLASRSHAHLFDPIPPVLARKMPSAGASGRYSDQSYLNWKLASTGTPCISLSVAWNWNPICGYIHPGANFVHFLGSGFFEPERDRQLPLQDSLSKRLRQMHGLVQSFETEVSPAAPALDLCVTSPEVRSCVPLPRYHLPAGRYEVEMRLQGEPTQPLKPIYCKLFGKKEENHTIEEWSWAGDETRVKRVFLTKEVDYPQFCFDSPETALRVCLLTIRWLGPVPRPSAYEAVKHYFQRLQARLRQILDHP